MFGEFAPKRLAVQMALPWARIVALPIDVLSTISRPVVWLLARATDLVVRLLGGRAEVTSQDLSPEELRELVISHTGLNPEQRQIISGALEIHDRTLREVLVPRGSVVTITHDQSVGEARAALAASRHSRATVTRGHHLDDVVGVVHLLAEADADEPGDHGHGGHRDVPQHRGRVRGAAGVQD